MLLSFGPERNADDLLKNYVIFFKQITTATAASLLCIGIPFFALRCNCSCTAAWYFACWNKIRGAIVGVA
jgi:hypothetical protein